MVITHKCQYKTYKACSKTPLKWTQLVLINLCLCYLLYVIKYTRLSPSYSGESLETRLNIKMPVCLQPYNLTKVVNECLYSREFFTV